jgi:hypothetical protein
MIDAGVHNDASYPSLKSPLAPECMHLGKHLYKAFLKHIFRVFPVVTIPVTNRKHFRAIPVV